MLAEGCGEANPILHPCWRAITVFFRTLQCFSDSATSALKARSRQPLRARRVSAGKQTQSQTQIHAAQPRSRTSWTEQALVRAIAFPFPPEHVA